MDGVFISYRRNTGRIYAETIADHFAEQGINYFLDTEGMYGKTGEFPKILQENIVDLDNFLLILSSGALDHLSDEESAVFAQEIRLALENEKNMIPVLCRGFTYPARRQLPEDLQSLPDLESVVESDRPDAREQMVRDILAKMISSPACLRARNRLSPGTRLEDRQQVEARLPLEQRLAGRVRSIKICAFSCRGFLEHKRDVLLDVMDREDKNCTIQVVLLDPKSPAAQEAAEWKIGGGSLHHRRSIISGGYGDAWEWQEIYGERFQFRVTDRYLPCAIFLVERETPEESTVKVDYYSFQCLDHDRRCVFIPGSDRENYQFYKHQFDIIWDQAKPVTEEP